MLKGEGERENLRDRERDRDREQNAAQCWFNMVLRNEPGTLKFQTYITIMLSP